MQISPAYNHHETQSFSPQCMVKLANNGLYAPKQGQAYSTNASTTLPDNDNNNTGERGAGLQLLSPSADFVNKNYS